MTRNDATEAGGEGVMGSEVQTSQVGMLQRFDEARVSGTHWRWATLASLADYFDAGSIAAGAVALTVWANEFGFGSTTIGLIAAFSSNGISAGVGAFVGGRLGDKLGRKRIYTLDLLLFAIGALVIACSVNPVMLIGGYILTGLAVGIDIPTSWALIAEFSPRTGRGKFFGLTVVMWLLGPIVVNILAVALEPLGLLGTRIIFVHLALVAFVVWWLRRGIPESPRWSALRQQGEYVEKAASQLGIDADTSEHAKSPAAGQLPTGGPERDAPRRHPASSWRGNLRGLLFFIPLYVLWGIPIGTYGFFLPYILQTVGATGSTQSLLMNLLYIGIGLIGGLLFIAIGDRFGRRMLWVIGCAASAVMFFLLLVVPISNMGMALANLIVVSFVAQLILTPVIRLWSVELFPTAVRGTFQGLSFAVMRVALGLWSLGVAAITSALGFTWVAVMFGAMYVCLLIMGWLFGPNSAGRSLEELHGA